MKGFDEVIKNAVDSLNCPGNTLYQPGDGMGAWSGGTDNAGTPPPPPVGYYLWITRTPSDTWSYPAPTTGHELTQTGWMAVADNPNPSYPEHLAIDGDPNTYWQSTSSSSAITFKIDLRSTQNVNGLTYLPRQDNPNGIITQYEIYLSTDGSTYGSSPVASGTWANDISQKSTSFAATSVQGVQIKALLGSGGGVASAAEINVYTAWP